MRIERIGRFRFRVIVGDGLVVEIGLVIVKIGLVIGRIDGV